MTTAEILLTIIVIALIAFILYYYFKGSAGHISISRPMESRVDEYLDRHFEHMVDEWSLMDTYQVRTFREHNDPALTEEEMRMGSLKDFRHEMTDTLAGLEERLNVLERENSSE
ncbi:hypothetical protein L0665_03450 [Methanogenium marinum]|uniref:Uncharacterized protein n=1 Tax=Methanogenium marinum TaxID=348610 RepID=A0A9Q4KS14_9EURY|nr:hypothetical protein [Methanogenium marinum]MDE4907667.1 hypothetical protein [Methanogenium marinum]